MEAEDLRGLTGAENRPRRRGRATRTRRQIADEPFGTREALSAVGRLQTPTQVRKRWEPHPLEPLRVGHVQKWVAQSTRT